MASAAAQVRPTLTGTSYCTHPGTWWCDSRRGWHFYDDPPEEAPAPPPPAVGATTPATAAASAASHRPPELARLERLQKQVDELRGVALMNPTEANVRRYMELEAKVVAQASYFADVARRVAWSRPELDMTLRGRPVNAKAIEVFEREQLEHRAGTLAALAGDHVLLFFFRGDCPYCHAFAPTLQAFASRHGLRVVAVSVDGGALPGFTQVRSDRGIARTLNVSHVPALYLARPSAGSIVAVGFGVLSESQLLERITAVAGASTQPAGQRASLP